MTERSITHSTFAIERHYLASSARVFAAFASADAKDRWADDPDYVSDGGETEFDFRVGGRERFGGKAPDGTSYRYDALYYDIVPGQRIVYCYEMYSGDARISVSVATVELVPADGGTRLTYTEQGAFLDGLALAEHREEGITEQLDNLVRVLRTEAGEAE
ncbi:MAG TPA: SRPBCC family protein [Streptosporangiaceae bacterium]|nr:SRPBCC family protein [Streptosporangiaceae bacterium]